MSKRREISFKYSPNDSGFTLIELIIVIVVLGVLGTMGTDFISRAFKGFSDADSRVEIYEQAKTAMVRMEREIRNAVPNAVNVNVAGDTISLGAVDEDAMEQNTIFGQYTESDPKGTNSITDRTNGLPSGSLVSVYNTNWGNFNSGSRIYSVTSAGANPMILDSNISQSSPHKRFFAVRDKAVRFHVSSSTLFRTTADVDTTGIGSFGTDKPLAKNISQTGTLPFFSFSPGALNRNGVVTINFTITQNNESVIFHKEVQIRNVP